MSGFIYGSTDLDSIFEPGNAGFDAGFVTQGQNVGNRYAPLSSGSKAAGTGFVRASADLNEYFAARGTVAPSGMWPVGGGFIIANNGIERFAFDTVTILCGRLTWQYGNTNGSRVDGAYGSNLIADRFNRCPGLPTANANYWGDFGGFSRGGTYGLPAGAVLRFEAYTDNLGGTSIRDVTCGAQYEWAPGWQPFHSGGCNLCSNNPPYVEDPMNIFDFSPPVNQFFGQHANYLRWSSPNNWVLLVAAMFGVSRNNGTLNVIRVKIHRIA